MIWLCLFERALLGAGTPREPWRHRLHELAAEVTNMMPRDTTATTTMSVPCRNVAPQRMLFEGLWMFGAHFWA